MFVAEQHGRQGPRLKAVKVLRSRGERDLVTLVRRRDAARQLAMLGHRHLVCTEDIVRVGDYLALLSPYVDGVDLLDWVEVLRETGTRMPGRVVCSIVHATASTLDAALNRVPFGRHEPLGMVHRDLKPANLMVDRDGEIKVLDLGTGYTSLAGRSAKAGALQKGLVKYIAPERRDGKRGGHAADIYALGILGIELFRGAWLRRLRGNNPAHDRHLAEVVATIEDMGMRAATDERSLRNLLLRMVAFDPDARPVAAEVTQTFRTLADRAPGPGLETFALQHALPWLEPVPDAPEADVAGQSVSIVEQSDDPDSARPPTPPLPERFEIGDDETSSDDETVTLRRRPAAARARAQGPGAATPVPPPLWDEQEATDRLPEEEPELTLEPATEEPAPLREPAPPAAPPEPEVTARVAPRAGVPGWFVAVLVVTLAAVVGAVMLAVGIGVGMALA